MIEIPKGWEIASFGELMANEANSLTDGPFGSKLKTAHYVPNGPRVIRLGNIGVGKFIDNDKAHISPEHYATLEKHRVFPSDLLIAGLAEPVGRCCIAPEDIGNAIVKADCFRAKPHPELSGPYLMYYLNSPQTRAELESQRHGIGRIRIGLGDLKALPVPVPPRQELCRIAVKLANLLARTRRARDELARIPRLIEHYKQAILAAAFRGDLTADWRRTQSACESAEALIARTPAPAQPRGGREATDTVIPGVAALSVNVPERDAPEGWCWVSLQRLAKQESGHTPSRKHPEYWGGDIPWLSISDAADHHGAVIYDTVEHPTQEGIDNSSARVLPVDTVCLSRTASVGYVVRMGKAMATSQDFVTWSCSPALDPDYLLYALLAEGDEIRRFGKGSTHTTIYFPEVRALHICLAPLDEQKEIVRRVKSALAWSDRIFADVARASTLIPALEHATLAKAFRGELVPQDPNDEPASVLLERIRAERATQPQPKRQRRNKSPDAAA